jgi:hypothetical protein
MVTYISLESVIIPITLTLYQAYSFSSWQNILIKLSIMNLFSQANSWKAVRDQKVRNDPHLYYYVDR